MKRYPVLSREQTESALLALQNGQSLTDLRSHALFEPHLEQEERESLKREVYHASPVRSYRQLFADSPTIAHLVSFGNFPTIQYWCERFRATYNGLPLPLEEFIQDALYKIVPDQAKRYSPLPGSSSSFKSYMSTMLIWQLSGLVDACIVERSMLPRGAYTRSVKPKHDTRRMYIESLDAPLPEQTDNGEEVTLYDIVENTKAAMPGGHLEREALYTLLTQAGITQKEAQVLQTYIIEGESQDYAASKYGVTLRTIRSRRDKLVKRLRRLGYENVLDILSGDRDVSLPTKR